MATMATMPTLITEVPGQGDAAAAEEAPRLSVTTNFSSSRSVSFAAARAVASDTGAHHHSSTVGRPLPRNVHFGVVTEAALRDAPFAKEHVSQQWRRLLQSRDYIDLSTGTFWWVHDHILEKRDRGDDLNLNAPVLPPHADGRPPSSPAGSSPRQRLSPRHILFPGHASPTARAKTNDADDDALFGVMAKNFVALSRRVPSRRKDQFLGVHFAEILAHTTLLTLGAAYPRKRDAFAEDVRLKRHLVRLCSEWTTGIRPRRVDDDHWVVIHGDAKSSKATAATADVMMISGASSLHHHHHHHHRHHHHLGGGPGGPKATMAGHHRPAAKKQLPEDETALLEGPLMRSNFTLQHSPFFRRFLRDRHLDAALGRQCRIGLTLEMQRVRDFAAHHLPDADRTAVQRRYLRAAKTQRASRVGTAAAAATHAPISVDDLLASSHATRREAMEAYSKQKAQATADIATCVDARRKIAREFDAARSAISTSDGLREYATNLTHLAHHKTTKSNNNNNKAE